MTIIQHTFQNVILWILYLPIPILFYFFWRQKKKIRKLEEDLKELDTLVDQNNEIINELIEDQEAMEEPLQKALVMCQFIAGKLEEVENMTLGPMIEKIKPKAN